MARRQEKLIRPAAVQDPQRERVSRTLTATASRPSCAA
jgi:hypothetical protein